MPSLETGGLVLTKLLHHRCDNAVGMWLHVMHVS